MEFGGKGLDGCGSRRRFFDLAEIFVLEGGFLFSWLAIWMSGVTNTLVQVKRVCETSFYHHPSPHNVKYIAQWGQKREQKAKRNAKGDWGDSHSNGA